MNFVPTPLAGVWLIEVQRIEDPRGFFARSFCQKEFSALGLNPRIEQSNVSFNRRRGTLRGMHYQVRPHAECKVVRCTHGKIWDVALDLRKGSSTFKRSYGVELSDENRRALYLPEDVAHGFQTLVENSEVLYLMSEAYHPKSARGVRWNDPAFGIDWPLPDPHLSERDANFASFNG